jgi:zinc protease
VNYLVGSNEAPPGFPGMAHAQEHMMFRGSPDLSANQLAAISAAMGGQFDADTQQTVTQYFFTVPKEDIDVALHIEALRMKGVVDTDALWDQERKAIEQEVAQDLSNPEYVFFTKLLAAAFQGTPYEHDALGTRSSFDKTTGTMLHDFYETWYAPNNAILVIAGDVDPTTILPEVERLFDGIPERNLPPRPAIQFSPVATKTLKLVTDLPYGLAFLSFRVPGWDDTDYAALKVLGDVLNSQRSTLYALVPEGKALDTGFSLSPLPQAGLGYVVGAFPQGGNGEELIMEMHHRGPGNGVVNCSRHRGAPESLSRRRESCGAHIFGSKQGDRGVAYAATLWQPGGRKHSEERSLWRAVRADRSRCPYGPRKLLPALQFHRLRRILFPLRCRTDCD